MALALFNQSYYLPAFFSPRNGSSPEDGFRLLVSSNPLLRFRFVVSLVLAIVVSLVLASLGKSSSGIAILDKSSSWIWPFLGKSSSFLGLFLN
jgi:hypothetical protein